MQVYNVKPMSDPGKALIEIERNRSVSPPLHFMALCPPPTLPIPKLTLYEWTWPDSGRLMAGLRASNTCVRTPIPQGFLQAPHALLEPWRSQRPSPLSSILWEKCTCFYRKSISLSFINTLVRSVISGFLLFLHMSPILIMGLWSFFQILSCEDGLKLFDGWRQSSAWASLLDPHPADRR